MVDLIINAPHAYKTAKMPIKPNGALEITVTTHHIQQLKKAIIMTITSRTTTSASAITPPISPEEFAVSAGVDCA